MPSKRTKRHASHEKKTIDESKAKKAKTLANGIHEACLAGDIDKAKVLLKNREMEAKVLDEITKKGTLIKLSENGKTALTKELLKNGVNPSCKNNEGQTPLHVACSKGHADIVNELLNYGANVDEMCNNKTTPLLSMNLWELSDEIVLTITKMLLDHGADINAQRGGRYGDRKTFLSLAVDKGNFTLVCELLKLGARVYYRDCDGRISLHGAANCDGIEGVQMIRELIKYGAEINAEDIQDNTPLHVASGAGNILAVKELLKHDPELISNIDHDTAFELAAFNGNELVVREFLKGENKDIVLNEHSTILNALIYHGNTKIVKLLLEYDVDVNSRWDEDPCYTPLHTAALKGYLEIAHELLENGADINAQDEDGKTPTHWLLEGGTHKFRPELDDYPEEELLKVMELFLDEKYGIDLTITCDVI